MNKHFNLLDERWLPVCMSDGRLQEVGLLELFAQAGQIRSLAETSPPGLIALLRLLLAILHRSLSSWPCGWRDLHRAEWFRQGLPRDAVRDYLELWRERFWLFHPELPFMQVAALAEAVETRDNLKPWTQISMASSTGNAPVVFDHSVDLTPLAIESGQAIRSLLGFLQFTPGGLVKVVRSSDKAGPLSNSAAMIPTGSTLNETLCLALHPYSLDDQDLPAWELPAPTFEDLSADPQLAKGQNDRYSRISRAVLFRREEDGKILWIHFAAGIAMEEDANAPDPMVSYRAGNEKLVRLSFRDGRAFWRDFPALVPDALGKAALPAAVLGWAANLKSLLEDQRADLPILVAGVSSDQAKLLRWRIEYVVLPVPLLAESDLAGYLREEVRRAEEAYGKLRTIGAKMLAESMPDPNRKETLARAKAALDTGSSAATFFSAMERYLPHLLKLISAAQFEEAHGTWSEGLQKAAWATWDQLHQDMGQSPTALRAESRAYSRLCNLVRSLRPEQTTSSSTKEVQA